MVTRAESRKAANDPNALEIVWIDGQDARASDRQGAKAEIEVAVFEPEIALFATHFAELVARVANDDDSLEL